MKKNEMTEYIANCDLFQSLNKSEIKKIAGLASVLEFNSGEDIFKQGEIGENIYIIIDGSVYLERAVDLGKRKGKAIIGSMKRGKALGCWRTLLGREHELLSFANCRKPTKVLSFKGAELNKLMVKDKKMGFKISQAMCSLLITRIEGIYGAMENL